jgi:hypothetical protein
MSYNLEQHLQAERSRKSKHAISTFRRLRKEFIKYGRRRMPIRLYDFPDGEYVSEVKNGRVTKVRSYIE